MNFSRFLNNQSFQIELPQKNLHYQVFKEQNSERNNLSKPSKMSNYCSFPFRAFQELNLAIPEALTVSFLFLYSIERR